MTQQGGQTFVPRVSMYEAQAQNRWRTVVLIVAFTVLYFRYLDAKADNRLDGGIDPAWLPAKPERASVEA